MTTIVGLGAAGLTVATIARTAPDDILTTRLALLGLALFVIALVAGSSRLVGLSSIPTLGAAVIAPAVATDPSWAGTLLVGCAWYLSVELAWTGLDRREHGPIGRPLARRRLHEVTTVVALTLAVGLVGATAADIAPPRSLYLQGPVVLALLAVLGAVTAQLARYDPQDG